MTACANDYSFKSIFSRNLEGLGKSGDVLICVQHPVIQKIYYKFWKLRKNLKLKLYQS